MVNDYSLTPKAIGFYQTEPEGGTRNPDLVNFQNTASMEFDYAGAQARIPQKMKAD